MVELAIRAAVLKLKIKIRVKKVVELGKEGR